MNILEKRELIALLIVILSAIAWLSLSVYRFFMESLSMGTLLRGGIVGALLLALGLLAYRWRHAGGWALVFLGIVPVFNAISRCGAPLAPVILIGVPCITSGILFLLDQ